MTRTYPRIAGIVGPRVTETELLKQTTVRLLNAEIFRRAIALMNIGQDEGHPDLGIGGGWRSSDRAVDEWFRRYTPVGTSRPRLSKFWNGILSPHDLERLGRDDGYPAQFWALKPGFIGVAVPYMSFHIYCPADALIGDIGAVAIDWYRELPWMQANCHRVGLRSFQHVPGEGHHTQPVEYPGSRGDFDPVKHKLTVWPLPGGVGDEDDMRYIQAVDLIDGKLVNDPAIIEVVGREAEWIKDGNEQAANGKVTGPVVPVFRSAFKRYYFTPPAPPPGYGGGKTGETVIGDFKVRPVAVRPA